MSNVKDNLKAAKEKQLITYNVISQQKPVGQKEMGWYIQRNICSERKKQPTKNTIHGKTLLQKLGHHDFNKSTQIQTDTARKENYRANIPDECRGTKPQQNTSKLNLVAIKWIIHHGQVEFISEI